MKKAIGLILVLGLILAFAAGCQQPSDAPSDTPAGAPTPSEPAAPVETPEKAFRVAMVFNYQINDGGWNETAYNGLVRAGEELGVETAYSDSVELADFETVLRDYAAQGFDLIIPVGNQFNDAVMAVAPSFPDVKFGVMNGNGFLEPNVAAYRYNTCETGFLLGVIAAMYTETNTVSYIGGANQPHIQDALDAFAVGAKYINPDIKVISGYTTDQTDVASGLSLGTAYIEQGADVIAANCGNAINGVIQACEEKGVRALGCIGDYHDVAPDTVMVSAIQDNKGLVFAMIQAAISGEFTPSLNLFGIADGAIYLSDWYGHDAELTADQQAKIQEVISGISDGSLKAQGILPKSVYEK